MMKFKEWYEKNKMIIWIVAILTFIIIVSGIFFGLQTQYCIDHPDSDWCKVTNATGLIKNFILG